MSLIIVNGSNWSIFTEERFSLKMTKYIYSICDVKADAFLNLFVMKTNAQAQRAFADLVNNPQTDFARHPEDYQLYNMGSWDEQTGKILPDPIFVCSGSSLLVPVHKPELKVVYNDKDPALVKDEEIV